MKTAKEIALEICWESTDVSQSTELIESYANDKTNEHTTELQKEVERLRGELLQTKNALSITTGILTNIRYQTDYMSDSYYEWIDRVLNEVNEFGFTEQEYKEIDQAIATEALSQVKEDKK